MLSGTPRVDLGPTLADPEIHDLSFLRFFFIWKVSRSSAYMRSGMFSYSSSKQPKIMIFIIYDHFGPKSAFILVPGGF